MAQSWETDASPRRVRGDLPEGVELVPLPHYPDSRGAFTELLRDSWPGSIEPVQWNAARSHAGVLRGIHAHHRHSDYLVCVAGRMEVGVQDLREGSPTAGAAGVVTLSDDAAIGLVVPTGVAHGFWFLEATVHVYAVSHEWDPVDELGCRFDDPGLHIPWEPRDPRLSERDRALGSLGELCQLLEARR